MTFPADFQQEMIRILGDEGFEQYKASFDMPRVYGLRVNTSKISVEDFLKISPFELKPIPWTSNGFYYNGDEISPAKHPYYYAGLYYLQEPSAMTPAELMPVSAGDRILDICAAPGGKSTELGSKLKVADSMSDSPSGLLVSNDISSSRARALLKNIEVFGIGNCMVTCEEPQNLATRFPGFFDKILIDAPCSGEGMFRKEHKMIKAWEEHGPQYFGKIQRSIINEAAKMLKPGGIIVYSTCTFSAYENEGTISDFLNSHNDFHTVNPTLLKHGDYEGFRHGNCELYPNSPLEVNNAIRIWPQNMAGEGHFICILKKDETDNMDFLVSISSDQNETYRQNHTSDGHNRNAHDNNNSIRDGRKKNENVSSNRKNVSNKDSELIEDTVFAELLKNISHNDGTIADPHKEQLFYIPTYLPPIKGIRFLRSGMYAGDIKKGRFEPSQAFAMTLKADDYKFTFDLKADDIRVIKYLKGETIETDSVIGSGREYVLVLLEGVPLGWAKANGTLLKNKYLPGWRITW